MLNDFFSSNPYYTAANLTAQVNLVPWTSSQLDTLILRNKISSPTANIILEYMNGKTGLVPAKPIGDLNGQNVRGTKGKLIRLDVAGYPQVSDLTATEINNRLRDGNPIGLQTLVQERWAEMTLRDANVSEFLLQGALENVIQAVDDTGAAYVLEDLTSVIPGSSPTVIISDWTDDTNDFADDIAMAKLELQQKLGGNFGQVTDWLLLCVGPAAQGIRRNKSIRTGMFLDQPGFALADKLSKTFTIDENVRIVTYNGNTVGGLSALDPDANGCAYLIPMVAGMFDEVAVPPEKFDTLMQPGLPRYSWMVPNVQEPESSIGLKYWSGKVVYCKRPNAIGKIKRA
jgi:hypothetical protein